VVGVVHTFKPLPAGVDVTYGADPLPQLEDLRKEGVSCKLLYRMMEPSRMCTF
jgi:hypothetical protein